MTETLTDRYVETAMRTVPEKQRADLAAELRGSIQDQIDARLEQHETREAAERAVLTALGDPEELAAGYTDRPLQLIGPRYYLAWWRLLKVLWAIVPACAAFGVALGMTIAGEPAGEIIGTVAAVTMSVIVHVGFWTTLVFFVVERSAKGADVGFVGEWTPDALALSTPRASIGELIASLIFLAAAVGAVLWDRLLGVGYTAQTGTWVSVLADGLWPWWIGGLFAVIALEALLAVTVYARGGWSMTLASANAALSVVFAVPAIWLLLSGGLIDPGFWPALVPAGSATTVGNVTAALIGFGIAAVAIWDIIDGFVKARRARQ